MGAWIEGIRGLASAAAGVAATGSALETGLEGAGPSTGPYVVAAAARFAKITARIGVPQICLFRQVFTEQKVPVHDLVRTHQKPLYEGPPQHFDPQNFASQSASVAGAYGLVLPAELPSSLSAERGQAQVVLMGSRVLVASSLFSQLPEGLQDGVIFLEPGVSQNVRVAPYTAPTILALEQLGADIGERVADVGSGAGLLSYLALQQGARHVLAIDIGEENEAVLRRNFRLNSRSTDGVVFCAADVTGADYARALDEFDPGTFIANMGPHYGNADKRAIQVLGCLTTVRTAVLAGYQYPGSDYFGPEVISWCMRTFGFRLTGIHANIYNRIAFAALTFVRG